MSDPNNWPNAAKRGAPANPEVSGWHWVFVIDRPEPCWWDRHFKRWGGPKLCMNGVPPAEVTDVTRYIEPLPLPTIAATPGRD